MKTNKLKDSLKLITRVNCIKNEAYLEYVYYKNSYVVWNNTGEKWLAYTINSAVPKRLLYERLKLKHTVLTILILTFCLNTLVLVALSENVTTKTKKNNKALPTKSYFTNLRCFTRKRKTIKYKYICTGKKLLGE